MASEISHAAAAAALGQGAPERLRGDWRFWAAAAFCAMLPDLDVIGFSLGVPYGDLWGHRGFTHSLFFAAALGALAAAWSRRGGRLRLGLVFFVIAASHGLLDALTNGGLGVAFFSPFDETRYFLPWRPIEVSPLGVGAFFTRRGLSVLRSELFWIWLPALPLAAALRRLGKPRA